MAGAEVEAEAAVVQVDAGVRLGETRSEAGRVGLDQRDAHATAVDGAEIGGVAIDSRCPSIRCPLRVDQIESLGDRSSAGRRRRPCR